MTEDDLLEHNVCQVLIHADKKALSTDDVLWQVQLTQPRATLARVTGVLLRMWTEHKVVTMRQLNHRYWRYRHSRANEGI